MLDFFRVLLIAVANEAMIQQRRNHKSDAGIYS